MVAWAQLLIGIGTMLGALTGSGLAIYSVVRARHAPRQAAEHAADHILHPNFEDEAALAAAAAAYEILLHQHQHGHSPEGHHEPVGDHHEHHHGGGEAP